MALVQKKASSKKNMVLGIVAGVIIVATLLILYFMLFREPTLPDDVVGAPSAGEFVLPTRPVSTKLDSEILDDPRLNELQQYGPGEVTVQQRGRKVDPFIAF